jgi:hypothetical protein
VHGQHGVAAQAVLHKSKQRVGQSAAIDNAHHYLMDHDISALRAQSNHGVALAPHLLYNNFGPNLAFKTQTLRHQHLRVLAHSQICGVSIMAVYQRPGNSECSGGIARRAVCGADDVQVIVIRVV